MDFFGYDDELAAVFSRHALLFESGESMENAHVRYRQLIEAAKMEMSSPHLTVFASYALAIVRQHLRPKYQMELASLEQGNEGHLSPEMKSFAADLYKSLTI